MGQGWTYKVTVEHQVNASDVGQCKNYYVTKEHQVNTCDVGHSDLYPYMRSLSNP